MTDRERLLEILNVPIYPHENVDPLEAVADFLLENGVTFATDTNVGRWIPAAERLPEEDGVYVVLTNTGTITTARWFTEKDFPANEHMGSYHRKASWSQKRNATHWMPLPEPPVE